jgi:hypothetical protein
MDEYDSVRHKVQEIFIELTGSRAEALRGDKLPITANDILGSALAEGRDYLVADGFAFNLIDWNADAAFLVAFLLFPERFTADELRAGVDLFMIHVPAHVLAAARLGGYKAEDIFTDVEHPSSETK